MLTFFSGLLLGYLIFGFIFGIVLMVKNKCYGVDTLSYSFYDRHFKPKMKCIFISIVLWPALLELLNEKSN